MDPPWTASCAGGAPPQHLDASEGAVGVELAQGQGGGPGEGGDGQPQAVVPARVDGGEVLVDPVAVLPQARPVPVGPVLPAAADIGHHEGAAALEPGLAHDRQVVDSQGHLEAAVAVEHGGHRTGGRPADLEVGHARAVLGDGRVLGDDDAPGVEALGGVVVGKP